LIEKDSIQVILVGGKKTMFNEHLKTFGLVRRQIVLDALNWKIKNDPNYSDVHISENNLNLLPENDIPTSLSDSIAEEVENVDPFGKSFPMSSIREENYEEDDKEDELMEKIGYVDLNGDTLTYPELFAASWNNTLLGVGHKQIPISEYSDDVIYGSFPELFPYGKGVPEGMLQNKNPTYSLQNWLKHLVLLHDKRFVEHHSFIFVLFNMIRRREVCKKAKLMLRDQKYGNIIEAIKNLKASDFDSICEGIEKGMTWDKILKNCNLDIQNLLNGLKIVSSSQQGSLGSKLFSRNHLRNVITAKRIPFIWLTLTSANIKEPIVALLNGISHDEALNLNSRERKNLVADDPVAAVEYFNITISSILHLLFISLI
jgi:hypothetical protein